MSVTARQQNGYLDATRSTGTPREVEYQLFTRVTGKLNRASREDADFSLLVEALNENLKLWQTIAFDVMDEDNDLPPMLRARLFYLYEFTQAHTAKVLHREADAAPLIEINTAIMRGLRPASDSKGGEKCPA